VEGAQFVAPANWESRHLGGDTQDFPFLTKNYHLNAE